MRLFVYIILTVLLASHTPAKATHIFGGELYYRHLSGYTYEVNLALYGDCNGQSFPALFNLTARINLLKDGQQLSTLLLDLDVNTRDEITPVCPKYRDSTQCTSPSATIYGVKRFIYRDTVTLPGTDDNYKFVFDGAANNAGRSNSITNLVIGSSIMYLEAELDNTDTANSSPQFTTVPTPFYCVNIEQEYNQGAVDADNDSLVFLLADALDGSGTPVVYKPGYSANLPLETGGAFEFNSLNGQMVFTPLITQSSVVVNKVYEYRKGKVVGSSMREMTFIVITNCSNFPVKGGLDTSQTIGGEWSAGNILNVCAGAGVTNFKYDLADPDGDTVDVTAVGLPAGASFTISGNNTTAASFEFTWNVSGVPNGNYTFFVTAKDRHCPISTSQTRGFTIRVVDPFEVTHQVEKPTNCYNKAVLAFKLEKGIAPATYTFRKDGTILRSFTDSATTIVDSFYAGNYSLSVSSPHLLCSTDYQFTVVDSGVFPLAPLFNNNIVCAGEDAKPLEAIAYPGATILWYDVAGNSLPSAPFPSTTSGETQRWLIAQRYKVCESLQKSIEVNVAPKPDIHLLIDTGTVCVGERILLKAT
ncbi:MAG TPA: hypothetical protein PL009_09755, partial [Flavipsychrobacter sp.]|nr:hypothetical protein [Flavipsychrobacter sp.]